MKVLSEALIELIVTRWSTRVGQPRSGSQWSRYSYRRHTGKEPGVVGTLSASNEYPGENTSSFLGRIAMSNGSFGACPVGINGGNVSSAASVAKLISDIPVGTGSVGSPIPDRPAGFVELLDTMARLGYG